ncbi:c-type cytochrome [Hymenobacter sp. DH14]|uniref:C-type cytochrome n=1 Tax=Hymenobacter cyanobacteriorum TaxID=2926463 RepID=A0A9X1VD59_9BACT|nr:cytochrome c peroxidase [Hymenobacter cyanobacteriorum]MCI1186959.1 c-type cytochrome [Hymenobacter cyanobacteriorum]
MKPLAAASLALGLAGLLLAGCGLSDVPVPEPPVPGTSLPANFPAPVYALDANPPNAAAFALGRSLFYDARLSRDGSVSCGSCHQQFVAFANAGHRLSHGVANRLGTRNAPALQNLRWKSEFFWDGGPKNLETLPLAPLTNPLEMDETLPHLLAKLNADPDYTRRFVQVYGPGPINSYQFLRALAQFTAALTSASSRYDQVARGEHGAVLSAAEQRGRVLVAQQCASCHATDLFSDESYRNNGLDATFGADSGRAHITARAADVGRFKVPSLRNVALTAPYMHDGRFATLEQVLAHYDHGVVASPTLDAALRPAGGPLGIPLTAAEQADIISFLKTLTDDAFVHDQRLAEQP